MISNGIDIVEIKRFDYLKNNKTFMNNTFTSLEKEYINKRGNNSSTIAGIYASKEALLKAIKKAFNIFPLKDIEISHNRENDAPFIILHNDLAKYLDEKNIALSISHDGLYAIAIVTILN